MNYCFLQAFSSLPSPHLKLEGGFALFRNVKLVWSCCRHSGKTVFRQNCMQSINFDVQPNIMHQKSSSSFLTCFGHKSWFLICLSCWYYQRGSFNLRKPKDNRTHWYFRYWLLGFWVTLHLDSSFTLKVFLEAFFPTFAHDIWIDIFALFCGSAVID